VVTYNAKFCWYYQTQYQCVRTIRVTIFFHSLHQVISAFDYHTRLHFHCLYSSFISHTDGKKTVLLMHVLWHVFQKFNKLRERKKIQRFTEVGFPRLLEKLNLHLICAIGQPVNVIYTHMQTILIIILNIFAS